MLTNRFAVLGLALALATGSVGCFQPHPEPTPCGPLPKPPEITDALRDKAMLSVAAHSVLPRVPDEMGLLSLPAAFGVLAADRDRLAPLRLRRAVAKVVAYQPPGHDVNCILKQLGIDPVPLARALQVVKLREARESAAFNALGDGLQVEDCGTADLQVHVVDANPSFTVTAEAWVSRSRDRVARILDPQSWDDCSTFWRRPQGTFLIDLDSSGNIPTGTPTPGLPETVGDPYPTSHLPRVLFEHFRCLNDVCSFELHLNLWTYVQDITAPIPGSAYHVWYNLRHQIWYNLRHQRSGIYTVLGYDVRVGLDTDYGLLQAVPDPMGGTRVYMSKTLRYGSAVQTTIAEAATAQYTEFAGRLADMLCCNGP